MNTNQLRIVEIADAIKAKGYRVFIAKEGTYGFYTDKDGLKIVRFGLDWMSEINVYGTYKTNVKANGSGWLISEVFDNDKIDDYIRAFAPTWAVGYSKVHYTTLSEFLKLYDYSSRYHEHK
jgi:hypothetical protein